MKMIHKRILLQFVLFAAVVVHCAVIGSTDDGQDEEFYIEKEEKVNWFQAWNNCSMRHMSLVSLNTKAKADALVKELKKIYGSDHPNIWIGGNGKNRNFIWAATNQTFTYKNWAPGQPDNKRGREHCALLWEHHNYRWNDGECLSRMRYVCERK